LSALDTFEVDVIVVMTFYSTGIVAKRILQTSLVVEHFVNKTLVKEGLQSAVHGDAIKIILDFFFDITMGERMIPTQKQVKNFLSARCRPEPEGLQKFVGRHVRDQCSCSLSRLL
jgi:hypothetical protein